MRIWALPKTQFLRYLCRFSIWFGIIIFGQSAVFAQDPGIAYGGYNNDQAFSVCLMADGNYAVLGRTRSNGAGSNDLYLLKISPKGWLIDSRTFGDSRQDRGWWVEAAHDGGLLITGYKYATPAIGGRHNVYFLKLDAALNTEIEQLYYEPNRDIGFCVREAHDAGYVIFGYSRSFGNFGDYYLIKTTSNGVKEWAKNYPGPKVDFGHEIRLTDDGGYLLFGTAGGFLYPSEVEHQQPNGNMMLLKIDGNGNEIWRQSYGGADSELGRAISPAADGGWYLYGSTKSEGAGSYDAYLLKVNATGDSLWSRTYGGTDFEYGNSMDVDEEGNLYLLGTTADLGITGTPDMFLTKTNPLGQEIWSLTIGGDASDYGHCVRALPGGGAIIAGDSRSFGAGGQDAYLVRVTSAGEIDLYGNPNADPHPNIIFPNPVVSISSVDHRLAIGDIAFEWRVYDVQGKLVKREHVVSGFTSVNRGDFRPGVYIYELRVDGEPQTSGKFIVY